MLTSPSERDWLQVSVTLFGVLEVTKKALSQETEVAFQIQQKSCYFFLFHFNVNSIMILSLELITSPNWDTFLNCVHYRPTSCCRDNPNTQVLEYTSRAISLLYPLGSNITNNPLNALLCSIIYCINKMKMFKYNTKLSLYQYYHGGKIVWINEVTVYIQKKSESTISILFVIYSE